MIRDADAAGARSLRAIIFDWGDTVMRVLPYAGPMAEWPEVAAVPGVADALARLAPLYRLVLATNAADSGRAQVLAALRRAGLDGRFASVITAAEAGARKPDPAFFAAALAAAGCLADRALMVGDDYATDVAGAVAIGLRSAWFNPRRQPCPEHHPAYEADLWHMSDLPDAVQGLHLPGIATCLAWLREQGAGPGLVEHARLVAAVAFRLAERLRLTGRRVDPLLAHRGGLLHDIAKHAAAASGQDHDDLGGELLRGRGHADLAEIAHRHAVWALVRPEKRPRTWEEKLVCYADRVADGPRLVPVEKRLASLVQRRPELAGEAAHYLAAARALEAEIAAALGVSPASLPAWLASVTACR